MRARGLLPILLFGAGCLAEPSDVWLDPPINPGSIHVATSEIQLLPFTIRMSKLANVLELPIDDPLFDTLYQQRFALGDHNYARALRPDRRWSARKIGIWVKGLLPICSSPRFAELYPNVSEDPSKLILRAYGRQADALDQLALAEIQNASALDHDTATCLALLSSLELVAR